MHAVLTNQITDIIWHFNDNYDYYYTTEANVT